MKKHFSRRFKVKALALGVSIILVVVLIAIATGATGAYFSDTKSGTVTGAMGTIQVSATGGTGGNNLDFNWPNMLPGVHYTTSVTFQNSGNNPEDVYLNFNNLTALSTLNTKGTYASVHIKVNGTPTYAYLNLNDQNSSGFLPPRLLLVSNLIPNATGTMVFDFEYASKLATPEPGGVFNLYPIYDSDSWYEAHSGYAAGYGQTTARSGIDFVMGQHNQGLPYQILATQVGISPDDTGGSAD